MAENSKIEWCDHTWNPWIGCTKVGPPCDNCYAEDMMDRRYGRVRWGAGEDRQRTAKGTWAAPLKWDRDAAAAGKIATVFCLSLGDIWDNEVDPFWRREAFSVMERTPNLLYLLLSKRIGNAVKMCDPLAGNEMLPRNAALGSTMATQDEWDRDMPKLREAARILEPRFTFASVEPMLGPIQARGNLPDWVICGGESGPKARPMHPDWARSIRDQCAAADVPFFFKQFGEWAPAPDGSWSEDGRAFTPDIANGDIWMRCDGLIGDGKGDRSRPPRIWKPSEMAVLRRFGKKAAGRRLDGRTHDAMPAVAP